VLVVVLGSEYETPFWCVIRPTGIILVEDRVFTVVFSRAFASVVLPGRALLFVLLF